MVHTINEEKYESVEEVLAARENERNTLLGKLRHVWWRVERIPHIPSNIYHEIKYFIQRGMRGYSDRDCWSVDWYLAEILPKMIERLNTNSHPSKIAQKSWTRKLAQMRDGFGAANKILEIEYDTHDPKAVKRLMKQFDQGIELFHKHFFDLWD